MSFQATKIHITKHRTQHLITEYIDLLGELGVNQKSKPSLEVDENWADNILEPKFKDLPSSYITIAPGVIYGPAKQWPINHFKNLIQQLRQEKENIVIIGTKNDRSLGETLKNGENNIINLCGKTDLNSLIAILKKSKLLISNDSGTMHVMAALQKPQIALFGSTSDIWTGPVNHQASVIKLNIECSPCFSRECRFGHYNCLNNISPNQVAEKVHQILL